MAATSWDPTGPKVVPRNGAEAYVSYGIYEATSQSFKAGQLVYNSSGATLYAGGDAPVLGIALKDATNTSSASAAVEIPIQIITPEDTVILGIATSADVLQTPTSGSLAVGTSYDTNAAASTANYIDATDTTNPAFRYQGPVLDATGAETTYGYFRLLPAEAQGWEG
jgi:hypothetical protein